MQQVRRVRRAIAGAAVAAAVLGGAMTAGAASASTGTPTGSDGQVAVQAVLDRVLGPGNAVVVVTDTVRTSASTTSSVRWGSAVPVTVSAGRVLVPGVGASRSVQQQNLVGGTATTVVTPPGGLVRRSVSVVVDRSHLGRTTLATIRRLTAAAAGVVAGRGDRVSVAVATFAPPAAPVPAAAPGPVALLLPAVVPLLWALGGIGALLLLVAAARGHRRTTGASLPR